MNLEKIKRKLSHLQDVENTINSYKDLAQLIVSDECEDLKMKFVYTKAKKGDDKENILDEDGSIKNKFKNPDNPPSTSPMLFGTVWETYQKMAKDTILPFGMSSGNESSTSFLEGFSQTVYLRIVEEIITDLGYIKKSITKDIENSLKK